MRNSCHATTRQPPRRVLIAALALLCTLSAGALAVERPGLHAPWTDMLEACVVPTADNHSTAIDYDCFVERRDALGTYLDALASVGRADYASWAEAGQLAFLINAYNAATVELILTAWPDLSSIRDLGAFLRSPWEKSFVDLLGETRTLDEIEHEMIREPGRFDEPRIHFAVNCASIGCPALRREAFTAAALEAQLEEQTRRFLADESRNRFREGRLEISPLFKWYREDFERGWRGTNSLEAFLARYAASLNLDDGEKRALKAGDIPIRYLDYDWSLNDLP